MLFVFSFGHVSFQKGSLFSPSASRYWYPWLVCIRYFGGFPFELLNENKSVLLFFHFFFTKETIDVDVAIVVCIAAFLHTAIIFSHYTKFLDKYASISNYFSTIHFFYSISSGSPILFSLSVFLQTNLFLLKFLQRNRFHRIGTLREQICFHFAEIKHFAP